MKRKPSRLTAWLISGLLIISVPWAVPTSAQTQDLTNLAHLDFLLDRVSPTEVTGHTTYRLAEEPELIMPWTYADARPGGTFERVGGGPLDPATGDYGQGAFNADDVTRSAVVYLRHWQQTGSSTSRESAYQLLRSVAYLQTSSGPNAGNVVLWMQPDGELNPSAEPVELPDPSDSDASYWLARSLWAFGEGYAAFADSDPEFADFLRQRLHLATAALEAEVLDQYGQFKISDGKRVPAWLIANGADATAEAALGLAAYVEAAPADAAVADVLTKLLKGIGELSSGDRQTWPYGAILPWAESRSMWHAWSSQMSVALAQGSRVLQRPELLRPAITETVSFDPTLLTSGGPDNGWFPTPVDKTQIAYGADSRLQSLLTVAEVAELPGLGELAALSASWYFGTNRSGQPIYDPATGVTFDGVAPDGTINTNSGAESTIHGLLSMLALDAHPDVRERAQNLTKSDFHNGITVLEAESATTNGTVVVPDSAWTGESQYSNGQLLHLEQGERATFSLTADAAQLIEPVSWQAEDGAARSSWSEGDRPLGTVRHGVGEQGITAVPGALLPARALGPTKGTRQTVTVEATRGPVDLDALIIRPLISSARWSGSQGTSSLFQSASRRIETIEVGQTGHRGFRRSYDAKGRIITETKISGVQEIKLAPGGFAVLIMN